MRRRCLAVRVIAALAAAGTLLFAGVTPRDDARAAEIEIGASENYVFIEPDFTGTRVVIFGAIDRPRQQAPRAEPYDIAITIRGPSSQRTVWKKDRVAGIWVNDESVTFENAPSFYLVLSTKPLNDLAPVWEREQYDLGLDALNLEITASETFGLNEAQRKDYKDALVRLKKDRGLWSEQTSKVEFLGDRLFRADADIPASVPTGLYRATVYLIRDGRVVGRSASFIRLQKIGIERFLSAAAQEQPLLYGIGAVLVAVAIGSLASLIFRR